MNYKTFFSRKFFIRKILLLFFPLLVYCQVELQGIIKDSETGNPVEHVLLVKQKEKKYTLSDKQGKYEIKVFSGDSILFSVLGYKDTIVSVRDLQEKQEIFLTRNPVSLPEVVLQAKYDFSGKKSEVGYRHYKHETYALLGFQETYLRLAVYMKNPEPFPLLVESIIAALEIGEKCNILVKLSLMTKDTSCDCPSSVLWHKYFTFEDFKEDFFVPVQDSILLPKEGLYIIFEIVKNDVCGQSRKNIFFKSYARMKEPLFFVSINGGKWKPFSYKKNRYLVPLMGLKVIYPKFD